MPRLKKPDYSPTDWISFDAACELLGIKRKTVFNYISTGKISKYSISTGVNGEKFFHKPSLMGFN